jgi:hypothetical protein
MPSMLNDVVFYLIHRFMLHGSWTLPEPFGSALIEPIRKVHLNEHHGSYQGTERWVDEKEAHAFWHVYVQFSVLPSIAILAMCGFNPVWGNGALLALQVFIACWIDHRAVHYLCHNNMSSASDLFGSGFWVSVSETYARAHKFHHRGGLQYAATIPWTDFIGGTIPPLRELM